MNIAEKLDALANYKELKSAADVNKQSLIDSILTPEIRQQIADIEAEFASGTAAVTSNIDALSNDIRAAVLANQASVKGAKLHAVLSPHGKTTWDTDALEEYSKTHPVVKAFKKEGAAYVTIRAAK